jgi:hypothetical protein
MSYIKKFNAFRKKAKNTEIVTESVIQMDDSYRIMLSVDVPQSLVNAVAKKVKEETSKKLTSLYSDTQVAEEIVKHIVGEYLKVDFVPSSVFVGGTQTQAQPQVQTEPAAQTEEKPQVQAQIVPPVQAQAETAQPAQGDFEEPKAKEEGKKEENELPA